MCGGGDHWNASPMRLPPLSDRGQVAVSLAAVDRQAMAAAFLGEALTLPPIPAPGLLISSGVQAVARVRGDLADPDELPGPSGSWPPP